MSKQNKLIAGIGGGILAVIVVLLIILSGQTNYDSKETVEKWSDDAAQGLPMVADDDNAGSVAPTVNETAGREAVAVETGNDVLDTPNPLGEIALGSPDAPVVIVEYSSLTCPHCAAFHMQTLPKLKEKYIDAGLVRIHFRPFPLNPFDTAGNMLAQCVAPKQKASFLDLIFYRQGQILQSEAPQDELLRIARQAGLSESDFIACLKDQNVLDAVRAMQTAASKELKVRSTPTFFVNGERLEGNQPLEAFENMIKPLLPEGARLGGAG